MKYELYEEAIKEALLDFEKSNSNKKPPKIFVVGAGRGLNFDYFSFFFDYLIIGIH